MKKSISLILVALVLAGCSFFQKKEDTTTQAQTTTTQSTTHNETNNDKYYWSSNDYRCYNCWDATCNGSRSKDCVYWKSSRSCRSPCSFINGYSSDEQGDFRSVAGTWRNSAGWEFHIDKDGNITSGGKTFKVGITEQQFQEGLLNWIMVPEGNENAFVGGAVFSFIPKNVELTYGVMSGDKDQSDISKDRIYGTQTVTDGKTIKTLMYYKVD